jgi:endonuclease YncB( thermonuclease family)
MVREGMAWAFVRYSADYIEQEQRAKADGLGVHAHACVPAWEWRAQRRGLSSGMP